MNRKQIIKMATQVYGKCKWHESALLHLEAFAKLVAAHERERICKQIAALHDSLSLASDPASIKERKQQ